MKKPTYHKYVLLSLLLSVLFLQQPLKAQDDTAAPVPVVKLRYFNEGNNMQYLLLQSSLKKGKVFTPQAHKMYEIFLDSSAAQNLIARATTDADGMAKTFIPPALKELWDASAQHIFIVRAGEEEFVSDYTITKSRVEIDTASSEGVKTITVTVRKQAGEEWVPVPEVEMKIGVKRLGGILSAGDEATYTTDSSGMVNVEFKRDGLPGDTLGNIILAARIEDNDLLGNLQFEKTVHWGKAQKIDHSFFDKRTLWTTRYRTPYWLLAIAYTIILSVWGTLIYLVIQLFRIRKLGRQ